MQPITIYKHETGEWVTDWKNKTHHVTFNTDNGNDFVSLGLQTHGAVRFVINQRGVILGVYDHRTDRDLKSVTFPVNHSLHRELNIGRPV